VHRRHKISIAVAAIGSTAIVASMLGMPSQAADPTSSGTTTAEGAGRTPGYLDARQLGAKAVDQARAQLVRDRSAADTAYELSLGPQAVLDFDPLTGTPRDFSRLDGFLTGPSAAPARDIALGYVSDHLSVLGLTSADLDTLTFRQDYVDDIGIHHLSWTQQVDGTPVFGNGLKVAVTRDGRVLSVQGSPVAGLAQLAKSATSARSADGLDAAEARSAAADDVSGEASSSAEVAHSSGGTTTWTNNDYAKRVWFLTPEGLQAGWSTYTQVGDEGAFQHVVSDSGQVLFRRSTIEHAEGDAYVYDNYPGAARGGKPKVVNLIKSGWLSTGRTFLNGTSVLAWADVNDDNKISTNEKTPVPGDRDGATFPLQPFWAHASSLCSKSYLCTWDPNTARSWQKNRNADVTQAFYLASNFHDYLMKSPIAFTAKAGNFSTKGGDPVHLNALDGAATRGGMPDGNHIDNANMNTPPDGTPPTMQMYLWHAPGATDEEDPFVPTSSAFDASVEYHEYTHGLSNRLVIDAQGNSTLNSIQAGSMGEAWSDYYAMDYLVKKGFVPDTSKSGEVFEGHYLTAGKPFRTMAIDCARGATARGCKAADGTFGGYTYGDFATVGGAPEVHSSGEVWAQTLWDIRRTLGPWVADRLITRGMSLSANNPSFLSMRNAIIQADLAAYQGQHRKALWKLFAARGMGFFSGTIDGDDVAPGQDFHVPPPTSSPRTSISGVVTDPTTGQPVPNAVVRVTGQGSQFSDVTDSTGKYLIKGLYAGVYRKVVASAKGYFAHAKPVDSRKDTPTNFRIVRDWAAASGGAKIIDFNGPDYTPYGCGPGGAIDLGTSTGWGSTTGDDAGTPTNTFVPKHITIDLRHTVNVTKFGVDPSATCGDGGSASTGQYKIETSVDGTAWVTAAEGTFTSADRNRLNSVTPTAGTVAVRFVRFTILSNQTPDFPTSCPNGGFSGCSFSDLSELAVFGSQP